MYMKSRTVKGVKYRLVIGCRVARGDERYRQSTAYFRASTCFCFFILIAIGCQLTACTRQQPGVQKLDEEYGIRGFKLGEALYLDVLDQAEDRALDYDVIEFETFGSRFADQQLYEQRGQTTIFGASVFKAYAGVIDRQVYAFLLQIEAEEEEQAALQDSLYAHYGVPQAIRDTTYYAGEMMVHVDMHSWEGKRVGMQLGRGEGFAEILIYDIDLRRKRLDVQRKMTEARRRRVSTVSEMVTVGDVRFDVTAPGARWRYNYRGELSLVQRGSFGPIDYSYVQPFFDVQGESLFGVQMAFVNMHFVGGTDSLRALEVRFDNTQEQTVGFMDMLHIMERKLGRHAYSDTLHTRKGPYRRALWYGDGITITLEENRFRPERPDRADVIVNFELDRIEVPWSPPSIMVDEAPADSVGKDASDMEMPAVTEIDMPAQERP